MLYSDPTPILFVKALMLNPTPTSLEPLQVRPPTPAPEHQIHQSAPQLLWFLWLRGFRSLGVPLRLLRAASQWLIVRPTEGARLLQARLASGI